jgi:hypothetical protein
MPNKDQTLANETAISRLLRRAAPRRRGARPSTPFASDSDPNREFARGTERETVWFFVFLADFHAAQRDRREDACEMRARSKKVGEPPCAAHSCPRHLGSISSAIAYMSIRKFNADTAA